MLGRLRTSSLRAVVALVVLGGSAACGSPARDAADSGDHAAEAREAAVRNLSPFWVDPDTHAAQQVRLWQRAGREEDAKLLRRIAEQPQAVWPDGNADPGADVRRAVEAASKAGRTAVLVAYNIPHRDCGQHSAGGAADGNAYRDWIGSFADHIEGRKAIVILEPDAVPHMVTGCTVQGFQEERHALLEQAVRRLKQQPHTKVYLDAGNSGWIKDTGRLARALWESGMAHADGFALNISNFQRTKDLITYGRAVSKRLDGAHFVIDTSRNGNGPLPGGQENRWCNPPGRALGTPPTTRTGDLLVDAFLWVKHPGDSDGQCRGGPRAGAWWPEYGLGLARAAAANDARVKGR